MEQRRADALERVADGFPSGDGATVHGGDRRTVHVHTDRDTLQANGNGAESTLEAGGNVSALVTANRRLGVDVSAETYIPDWDGQRMEDDLVVDGLFQLE